MVVPLSEVPIVDITAVSCGLGGGGLTMNAIGKVPLAVDAMLIGIWSVIGLATPV